MNNVLTTTTPEKAIPAGLNLLPAKRSAPLDTALLTAELEAHNLAIDAEFTPRQFAGGLANLNYLIRLEDGWAVLRRPPSGPLPPGANDMAREHRILSNLWRVLPLAPRSLHLCTDAAIIGVPFQILEFRSGQAIRGDKLSLLSETADTGRALSALLIDTLALVHEVVPEAVGLETLGRPEGFFPRQVIGWVRRANYVCGDMLPTAAAEVAGWLTGGVPPPEDATVLLHCDFKLDNILLDTATLKPGTIVDWDMGTRGPALFDLATMLSYWTEAGDPDCMHRLAQMPTAKAGFLSRAEAAHAYERRTGRSIGAIRSYRVLTIFKLAVVFLQLHRRYLTGETSDPRYVSFGSLGEELFVFALDVARGRLF